MVNSIGRFAANLYFVVKSGVSHVIVIQQMMVKSKAEENVRSNFW